jgi:hypothetical protein
MFTNRYKERENSWKWIVKSTTKALLYHYSSDKEVDMINSEIGLTIIENEDWLVYQPVLSWQFYWYGQKPAGLRATVSVNDYLWAHTIKNDDRISHRLQSPDYHDSRKRPSFSVLNGRFTAGGDWPGKLEKLKISVWLQEVVSVLR